MAHYINKEALIAEINRQHKILMQTDHTYGAQFVLGFRQACRQIIDFLDTPDVKDVDLESEQRMRECPYRQVVCTMYEGKMLECKGACSWVVDYPKLKELKAQKGE